MRSGEQLPAAEVQLKTPGETVSIYDHFRKYNIAILISVPGAFTPSCTAKHVPTFIQKYDELKSKGVEEIACMSVNDAFVMTAWGESLKTEGKMTMLADPSGAATKALGLDFDISALGGLRAKRAAILLKNGVAVKVIEEPDNTTFTITGANDLLKEL